MGYSQNEGERKIVTNSNYIREAIAAANGEFMAAFKQSDVAGLANLYTEDGQDLPPNADFDKDQKPVQGFWQAVFDMGIKEAEMKIFEVEKLRDTADEFAKFKLLGEAGQVLDGGRHIVVWKRQQRQSKLYRDIFNGN
jgi:ketosteroid isomerase-like protein